MVADAESLLWARRVSGSQYLAAWRIIHQAPPLLQDALVERYLHVAGPERRFYLADGRVLDSFNDAYADLRRVDRDLRDARPARAFDDDEIETLAGLAARHCMAEPSVAAACAYALAQGVAVPRGPRVSNTGLRRRLTSADWWRRRLRTVLTRRAEELFRRLGFVRRQATAYVSGDAFHRIRQAATKSRNWLQEMTAVCEDTGESMPLLDIAEHSLSNPKLRRGELMARARGFQEVAEALGHRCLMITLTCPSAFHAWLRDSGEPNPRYAGATPRDGQKWLNTQWARARATLKRRGVVYYGFRASEPHHDATPHWHMVIYAPQSQLWLIRVILRKTWLREYRDEPGAVRHRVRFTAEQPAKGSGVGYMAKYVAKSIDGHGTIGSEVSDESGQLITDDAQRAIAWARLHGIRQFQQLSGPAVTLWRELRRVREASDCEPLEALRLTTEGSDEAGPSWSRFITQLGGIVESLKRSRELLDKAEPRVVDRAGRRVIRLNRWGELPGEIVVGVQMTWRGRIHRLATRVHVWFLLWSPGRPLGPVATTVRYAGSPSEWTNPRETSQAPPAKQRRLT